MAGSALARKITGFHTTPEQAAKVFSLSKPRLAVYTHVAIPPIGPSVPTVEQIVSRTKKTYTGQVVVGQDLMVIQIGQTVQVIPAKKEP
jgi:ribonuclease Z